MTRTIWTQPQLTKLRRILARRYPREAEQRRVVTEAGLDVRPIAFDASADNSWLNILDHANRVHKLDDLDLDLDSELRYPLVAVHHLRRMGLDAFLTQNDGEGWMLADTLRLADYDLGHDPRQGAPAGGREARQPLPRVAACPGVEEPWEECRRHAERALPPPPWS